MTNFGDLKTEQGVSALNSFLADKSYISGYTPSQADCSVYDAVSKLPAQKFSHALRWYKHISSYGQEKSKFPGDKLDLTKAAPAAVEEEEDDDDVDLFGSDDDDQDEEAERIKQERLAAYADKKSKKPGPIAKSSVLLDCKPWDDETDMEKMEEIVRGITLDGLVWGAAKFVPLAYGIRKLSILCIVEDAKVSIQDLQDTICEFEDYVQSVDIAAFNKI